MVATTMRWLSSLTRATCAAPAIAASTSRALLPSSATGPGQSSAILPAASGHSCGAPSRTASRMSMTGVIAA